MAKDKLGFEILYFDDCPSWKNTLEILKSSLGDFGITPEISLIQVETHEDAVKYKFEGSPTIRVNGDDLFPTGQDQYALGCRVFQTVDGYRGWPSAEMINEKLALVLAVNEKN